MSKMADNIRLVLKLLVLFVLIDAVGAVHPEHPPDCGELGAIPLLNHCSMRGAALGNNSCADEYREHCTGAEELCCEMGLKIDSTSCDARTSSQAPSYCSDNNTFTICCECCETAQTGQGICAEKAAAHPDCPRATILACCEDDTSNLTASDIEAAHTAGLTEALNAGSCTDDGTIQPILNSLSLKACECCLLGMIPSEEPCSTRIPRISEDNDCRTYFSQCCVEYPIITINYVKGLGSSDEHRDCATRAQALVEEGFNETDPAVESFIDACECCEEGRAFIGTHSAYVAHMDAMTDSWCRRAFEICASPGSDSTQDGDPHFVTFDGARITYNGPCRYTLTQTDPRYAGYLTPFTVTAMNAIHKADLASYLDDVEMTIGQRRVRMNVRGELFVDGQPQTAPISDGMFKVKRDVLANVLPFGPKRALGEPVLRLETGILVNLTVTVQRPDGKGRYYLNIEVPKMYRGKLTGLGGNFNGDPMDDYRLSDGRDVRNIWPEIFRSQMIADSWLVKDDPVNLKTGYPC